MFTFLLCHLSVTSSKRPRQIRPGAWPRWKCPPAPSRPKNDKRAALFAQHCQALPDENVAGDHFAFQGHQRQRIRAGCAQPVHDIGFGGPPERQLVDAAQLGDVWRSSLRIVIIVPFYGSLATSAASSAYT